MSDARVAQLVTMFESMAPQDVPNLARWYTGDAVFKDPFNDVRGLAAIQRVYAHMFEALEAPRFVVTGRVVDGTQCVLLWDFHFAFRSKPAQRHLVPGASHLHLAADGRIAVHRDHWDAAELYDKLPLVGRATRWLRRRMNGSTMA